MKYKRQTMDTSLWRFITANLLQLFSLDTEGMDGRRKYVCTTWCGYNKSH